MVLNSARWSWPSTWILVVISVSLDHKYIRHLPKSMRGWMCWIFWSVMQPGWLVYMDKQFHFGMDVWQNWWHFQLVLRGLWNLRQQSNWWAQIYTHQRCQGTSSESHLPRPKFHSLLCLHRHERSAVRHDKHHTPHEIIQPISQCIYALHVQVTRGLI